MCASCVPSCVFVLQDSLAAEIEGTMRKELSLDDPECEEQKYELEFNVTHEEYKLTGFTTEHFCVSFSLKKI